MMESALDRMRALPCNAGTPVPWMNTKHTSRMITSFIDPSAILGEGTIAWWYSRILAKVVIGDNCSIGGGTEIGVGSVIGNRSRIGANCFLPPNSQIGEDVFIGPGCVFTDDRHPRVPAAGDPPYDARPPIIHDGASIGAGAVILPGIVIGAHARVAAGSVVAENVEAGEMVMGAKARRRTMPVQWSANA